MPELFGYSCEYCDGTVRPKQVKREVFRHVRGFVILEEAVIGVCDTCGHRYYSAALLRRVREIATGAAPAERTELVPVAHA